MLSQNYFTEAITVILQLVRMEKNSGLAILEIAGVQTLPLRIVWPVGDTHESLKFSNSLIYSIVEICSPNAITKPSFMLFVFVATIIDLWPN